MAESDGAVVIPVDMNIDDAEKEMASLKQQYKKLQEDVNKNTFQKNALEESAKDLNARLQEAKDTLKYMQDQPAYTFSKSQIEEQKEVVKGLQKEYDRIEREIASCNDKIRDGNIALDYTQQRYGEIYHEAEALRQTEGEKNGENQEKPDLTPIEQAREKVKAFSAELKTALGAAGQQALQMLGNGFKRVGGLMQSAFSKGIKLAPALGKGILKAAKNMNVFSRISEVVGPAMKRMGQMVKQAFVFGVVTKGLTYLREKMGDFLNSNAELMGSVGQLKGALLTAFQPIYSAVIPALQSFLNIVTRIVNTIGRFIAALFGTTAKQAQAGAKALNDESKALSGTGEAAEEAAGSLASFDEINTIQTENAQGGGSGGGADEAGAIFEPETDETVFDSWGEAFSAFLDDILNNGIPKLKAGFERFADWLNDFSKKLYDMFTFDGVREKVQKIGSELAAALNDLVSGIDWRTFGAAIGAGLDLAIVLAVNALYGFDWKNLGASLADALNGLIMAVNWTDFGKLLWSGFKIAIETLTGLLLNVNMVELAHSASEMIIGFFNAMKETIANIDWQQVGQQIKTFLVNVDWISVAEAIAGALGAAVGATAAVFWELIKEQWQKVVTWWRDKCHDEDGNFVWEGFLEGISNAVSNIYGWVKEHVFKPFMDAWHNIFGIHSPSTVMAELGGYLMDGLLNGILNRFGPVIDSVKLVLGGILDFVTGVFTGDWSRAWDGVSNIFRGIWNGIIGVLENAVNLVVSGINWMLSQLNRLRINIPDWLGGGSIGFSIPLINGVSIPRLAQGAVIPPNREFMAVLGDQKSGYNYEVPDKKLRQLIREEISGSNNSRPAEVKIYLDRKLLGSVLIDEINDRTIQAGRSVLKI